jgi:hypothetical protein
MEKTWKKHGNMASEGERRRALRLRVRHAWPWQGTRLN